MQRAKRTPLALPQAITETPAQPDGEQPKSGVTPVVQNTIATVNLGCRLDLRDIALRARNCEYNPKRFTGAVMRIRDPKTTALFFSTGKMVVTGAKSEEWARKASRKFARILQKLGYDIRFREFKIQNIVAVCDAKFPIRLEGLALSAAHRNYASYEPELFPGLIYRMLTPIKVVLLIFVNGKVVLTGAKDRDDIREAFDTMYPILKTFTKS